MPVCAVPTCTTNHRTVGKTLYRFPKDNIYAHIWTRCCMKKDSFNTRSAYICSLHFAEEAYQHDINHDVLGSFSKRNLRKDAVPTLQLPSLRMLTKNSAKSLKSDGAYMLFDAMPSLPVKSSMHDFKKLDLLHSSRVQKYCGKYHHSKYRSNSISSDKYADISTDMSSEKDILSSEYVPVKETFDENSEIPSSDAEKSFE